MIVSEDKSLKLKYRFISRINLVSLSAGAPITKSHMLGVLNNRHLFLTVLEARNSKIKVQVDLILSDGHLLTLSSLGVRLSSHVSFSLFKFFLNFLSV